MTRSRIRSTFGLRAYLATLILLFTVTAVVSTLYVRAQAEVGARREVTREAQFAADLAASEVATSLAPGTSAPNPIVPPTIASVGPSFTPAPTPTSAIPVALPTVLALGRPRRARASLAVECRPTSVLKAEIARSDCLRDRRARFACLRVRG